MQFYRIYLLPITYYRNLQIIPVYKSDIYVSIQGLRRANKLMQIFNL